MFGGGWRDVHVGGGVTHFLSSSHTELQDLPSQQSWPHQSWCSNHCHTQSESVDASSLHISNTTCLTLQTSCFFTVHSHSTTVTLPQSSYHSHPTTVILQQSYNSHPTTVILPQSSYHSHPTTVILLQSSYNSHPTTVTLPQSSYNSHPTTVILQQSSYYSHPTTVILQQSPYYRHPTTVIHATTIVILHT